MITTSAMIQLGRIKDNKMVDMQLSNHKLVDRGIRILINELNISKAEAKKLLETHQNVRAAINAHKYG
jgi:N-acetylmuramic acid 6-phosphate etherase